MIRSVLLTGDIFRLQARGGITRQVLEITKRIDRPVRIVAGLHQSQCLDEVTDRVTASTYCPAFKGSAHLRAIFNRFVDARWLKGGSHSIIHASYYRDPASLPAKAPIVATVHDMAHERLPDLFRRSWWKTPDPARHKMSLCARSDAIVCVSETTRRDLVEYLPSVAGRTRVVHNGLNDWSGFVPRAIPGLSGPFFLWVGERGGYKNFLPTLRAWSSCRAASDTRLLCVGGGALRSDEREALDACGASQRVEQRFCTNGELRWAYERASGLLLTSRWEGFGMPLIEAMAHGCPVVASDIPALREVGGDHALYVDPEDQESIGAGIEACLSQGRETGDSGAARLHAQTFSWDTCAAGYEALYRELD